MNGEFLFDRRKFRRIEAKFPVRFQIRESGLRGSSITQDISEGGAQILVNEFLPVSKNLLLEFFLSEFPSKTISAVGKIIWSETIPYSERYRIGLEFNQISDEARKNISEFVFNRSASQI